LLPLKLRGPQLITSKHGLAERDNGRIGGIFGRAQERTPRGRANL
jgi:hypothetical protein